MRIHILFLALLCSLCGYAEQELRTIRQAIAQLEWYVQSAHTQSPESVEKARVKLRMLKELERVVGSGTQFREKVLKGQLSDYQKFEKSAASRAMLTESEMREMKEYIRRMSSVGSLSEMNNLQAPISTVEGSMQAENFVLPNGSDEGIRRGDLLFRTANGPGSTVYFRASTREKRFTHAGVVVASGEDMKVVDFSVQDAEWDVRAASVPICEFMNEVSDLAVYRYSGPDAEKVRERIARAAEKRIGTPFDPAFDLKTKDRLYCTEMVRDCVNEAAGHEVIGTSRKGDFEYVAVDDCYRNEMTKVWDCRDQKPEEKQQIQKLQSRPVVIESSSTTNAPVRRTIRFIPKNGGRR